MRPLIYRPRVKRTWPTVRATARASRPNLVVRRSVVPVRAELARRTTPAAVTGFAPNPYVDYSRTLTAEGGIAIVYKDIDASFGHTLRRIILWSCATGGEAWFLFNQSPVASLWINLACLIAVAIVNWLIVAAPVQVYGTLELRPDCLIIGESEIFWLRNMENGWPTFYPDGHGNKRLSGVYGTRWVDYLTLRRFDPLDRTPEVIVAHFQHAIQQLWERPH